MVRLVGSGGQPGRLARRLTTTDAVVVGLGAMIGAGVFASFGPAAAAAGDRLLLAVAAAAVVAWCNATSSARLAARYPEAGGTYAYGRHQLGTFWGYLAGWCFVVGKTASCAAMALTVGTYLAPGHPHPVAVAAVAALTAVNWFGVRKAVWLTRVIVAAVLLVLLAVVLAAALGSPVRPGPPAAAAGGPMGLLQAAGIVFFAFAGYARIATLGEEVREPARTIGRAIPLALGVTLVVYAAVAWAALRALGPAGLASAAAPLADAVRAAGAGWLAPIVRVGGAVAALGSLLALVLGVSRTGFAMARHGDLPSALSAVHPRYGVPHRAELAVGVVAAVLAGTVDLRGAIGFSSFGVLVYYALANASAFTLRRDHGGPPRWVPVLGALGCLVLAVSLPRSAVVAGAAVVALGAALWLVTRRRGAPSAG
jgi:APA family basic amino acid/polyamine antiporter